MDQLIKLNETTLGGKEVNTVSARELHNFLESKRQFSDWIKAKIERLRLVENEHFVIFSQSCEKMSRGRPTEEYFVTLEMAKHIALMENTDRGFEVRDYFIECERQLLEQRDTKSDLLYKIIRAKEDVDRALALNDYERQYVIPLEHKVEEQEQELTETRPKAHYFDIVMSSKDLLTVTQIGHNYGLSAIKLNNLLHELGIQYKSKSGMWMLYAEHKDKNYARLVTRTYTNSDGEERVTQHLKWTQEGCKFLYDLLKEEKGITPKNEELIENE